MIGPSEVFVVDATDVGTSPRFEVSSSSDAIECTLIEPAIDIPSRDPNVPGWVIEHDNSQCSERSFSLELRCCSLIGQIKYPRETRYEDPFVFGENERTFNERLIVNERDWRKRVRRARSDNALSTASLCINTGTDWKFILIIDGINISRFTEIHTRN